MKNKKYIVTIVGILSICFLIGFSVTHRKPNGATLESRELRLRKIDNLGPDTSINQEIMRKLHILLQIQWVKR